MNKNYTYKIKNVREGIKFLMDNPNLTISVRNSNDLNGYSKLFITKNGELNKLTARLNYNEVLDFIKEPINIFDKEECLIDGLTYSNFYYTCSRVAPAFNIKCLNDLYNIVISPEKTDLLIKYCRYVYWIFLNDVLESDFELPEDKINKLHELFEN